MNLQFPSSYKWWFLIRKLSAVKEIFYSLFIDYGYLHHTRLCTEISCMNQFNLLLTIWNIHSFIHPVNLLFTFPIRISTLVLCASIKHRIRHRGMLFLFSRGKREWRVCCCLSTWNINYENWVKDEKCSKQLFHQQ
jgi:hypothetical protein